MVDEIGVEPDRELRRLHDAILRQDAALDLPAAVAPSAAVSSPVVADGRAPPVAARTPGRRVLVAAAALVLVGGLAVFAVSRWSGPERLASIDENAVGLIDPETARITAQYPVGRAPSALAVGGGSVWVANAGDGTVSRIEPGRDQIVTIPVGEGPSDLAFAAGSLWVTDRGGAVWQISPAVNRVVRRIAAGNAPRGIVAGFGALWVASEADRTVTRIDLGRGAVTQRIDLGANPTALAVGAGAVWVTSEEGATVFRIEPRSGDVVRTIAVGNGPVDVAVAYGAAWTANRQDATVSRVDTATDAVTDIVKVPRDPSAIAAGDGGVWVASPTDGTVTRIDPVTRRTAETIAVRSSPSAIAVADGKVWTAALAAPATHRGGTLRVEADPFDYNRLEPASYGDLTADALLSLAYDGLVAYRRAGGATFGPLVGALATDVPRPSPDGRTYVFKLRPKLRYSDGSPVRPEDFRASLEALFRRDPGLGSYYQGIVGGQRCARRPARCDLSAGIVSDARRRTITIHLTRPDGEFLHGLAYSLAVLAPAAQPFGRTQPPGTGPYRIVSYDRKRGARLVRNPHFGASSPGARPDGFADEIVVRVNPDRDAQVAAVQRGEADVVPVVGPFGGAVPAQPAGARDPQRGTAPHQRHPRTGLHVPQRALAPVRRPARPARAQLRRRPARDHQARRRARPRPTHLPAAAAGLSELQAVVSLHAASKPRRRLERARPRPGAAPDRAVRNQGHEASRSGSTAKSATWPATSSRCCANSATTARYASSVTTRPTATRWPVRARRRRWASKAGSPTLRLRRTSHHRSGAQRIAPRSPGNANLARFCDRRLESRIEAALAARGPRADALWRGVYRDLEAAAPAIPLVNRRAITLVSKRVGNYQQHPLWTTLLEQLWIR